MELGRRLNLFHQKALYIVNMGKKAHGGDDETDFDGPSTVDVVEDEATDKLDLPDLYARELPSQGIESPSAQEVDLYKVDITNHIVARPRRPVKPSGKKCYDTLDNNSSNEEEDPGLGVVKRKASTMTRNPPHRNSDEGEGSKKSSAQGPDGDILGKTRAFPQSSEDAESFIAHRQTDGAADDDSDQTTKKTEALLPEGFEPSPYTVVVGKGRIPNSSVGNQRIRVLAAAMLPKYTKASSRSAKTQVISDLIQTVRNAAPAGPFVKFKNGRWWEVGDHVAREKVGYIIRDLLHDQYRSSSRSKSVIRKQRKQEELDKQQEDGDRVASASPIQSQHQILEQQTHQTRQTGLTPYQFSLPSASVPPPAFSQFQSRTIDQFSQTSSSYAGLFPARDVFVSDFTMRMHEVPFPLHGNFFAAGDGTLAPDFPSRNDVNFATARMPPPVPSGSMAISHHQRRNDDLIQLFQTPFLSSSDDIADVFQSPTTAEGNQQSSKKRGASRSQSPTSSTQWKSRKYT